MLPFHDPVPTYSQNDCASSTILKSPPSLHLSPTLHSISSSESTSPLELDEKDITTMQLEYEILGHPAADNGLSEDASEEPDPEYYMEMITFKVEGVLFRVPAHLFRSETTFFDSLLDDRKIIVRDDVAKSDFRVLLKLLYPMTFAVVRTLSDREWISVLKVSTKWLMREIRHMAIDRLSSAPLAHVDRVVLAKECSILSWLRSTYLTLMDVKSELSHHDKLTMEKLGLESSFKLHCARESVFPRRAGTTAMRKKIDEAFGVELETLDDRSAIERAVLAQTYNISEWRRGSFVELAERKQVISVEEAQILGYQTAIQLCGAREMRTTQGVEDAVRQELGHDFETLNSHTSIERLVLARKYAVRVWVRDALYDLGELPEPLSASEARSIGLHTAIALCRARHDPDQLPPGEAAYRSAIEREFQAEFAEVEMAGNQLLSKSEIQTAEQQRLEEKWRMEQRQLEDEVEKDEVPEKEDEVPGKENEVPEKEEVKEITSDNNSKPTGASGWGSRMTNWGPPMKGSTVWGSTAPASGQWGSSVWGSNVWGSNVWGPKPTKDSGSKSFASTSDPEKSGS
ncbi:hypothetical protein DXG01_005497 [Tephrocybe rancida]|nr:hypothetical protein DXG01_005497 [Tephrocybe rancida]